VLDEMEGSGDRDIGGGVINIKHWYVESWMVGREHQKDDIFQDVWREG
jgi:hypothetical protein